MKVRMMIVAAALTLAACGDPQETEKAEAACPVVEGDRHLAGAKSEPGAVEVMVHVVGRECLVAGENRLHLYKVLADEQEMEHSAYRPLHMAKTDDLTVTAVRAVMPSMGHGTAEEPVMHGGGAFSIDFQMPGAWDVEVEFAMPDTTVAQTATFRVDVK